MGLRPLEIFQLFQCGDRIWKSESDVCRRQILTSKDGPRIERVKQLYWRSNNADIMDKINL